MKVVLIRSIDKVGSIGQTIDVAPGYGRNFLLRRGLAVLPEDPKADEVKKQQAIPKEKPRKPVLEKISKREKRLLRQEKKK